jgi:hypothetical protein
MKKIIIVATAALCLAGNVFAEENPGGDDASDSAFGYLNGKKVVAAAVGVGVLGAMVANNRGNAKTIIVEPPGPGPGPDPDPDPECGAGEELIDGVCVPVTTTTTVTTTVTNTVTNAVTNTIAPPVTVTATTTL